ncbi:hypothetical protein J6590_015536 [Homalodisca vitripennis]|nr:hypothetical protein J6590_015536 [Homalodisca vitripennis]
MPLRCVHPYKRRRKGRDEAVGVNYVPFHYYGADVRLLFMGHKSPSSFPSQSIILTLRRCNYPSRSISLITPHLLHRST